MSDCPSIAVKRQTLAKSQFDPDETSRWLAGLEVEIAEQLTPATKNALASLFQLQGERRAAAAECAFAVARVKLKRVPSASLRPFWPANSRIDDAPVMPRR
jgi:hypothetical protein